MYGVLLIFAWSSLCLWGGYLMGRMQERRRWSLRRRLVTTGFLAPRPRLPS